MPCFGREGEGGGSVNLFDIPSIFLGNGMSFLGGWLGLGVGVWVWGFVCIYVYMYVRCMYVCMGKNMGVRARARFFFSFFDRFFYLGG